MFYLDISPSIQKPHVPAITEWLVYTTLFFVQGREASCANNHWMTCVHDCVFCPGSRVVDEDAWGVRPEVQDDRAYTVATDPCQMVGEICLHWPILANITLWIALWHNDKCLHSSQLDFYIITFVKNWYSTKKWFLSSRAFPLFRVQYRLAPYQIHYLNDNRCFLA